MSYSDAIKKANTDEWFTMAKDVEIIIPFLKLGGVQKNIMSV